MYQERVLSPPQTFPFPPISRFTEIVDRYAYAGELLTRSSSVSVSSWGVESSIKELDLARNQIATAIQSRYSKLKLGNGGQTGASGVNSTSPNREGTPGRLRTGRRFA